MVLSNFLNNETMKLGELRHHASIGARWPQDWGLIKTNEFNLSLSSSNKACILICAWHSWARTTVPWRQLERRIYLMTEIFCRQHSYIPQKTVTCSSHFSSCSHFKISSHLNISISRIVIKYSIIQFLLPIANLLWSRCFPCLFGSKKTNMTGGYLLKCP